MRAKDETLKKNLESLILTSVLEERSFSEKYLINAGFGEELKTYFNNSAHEAAIFALPNNELIREKPWRLIKMPVSYWKIEDNVVKLVKGALYEGNNEDINAFALLLTQYFGGGQKGCAKACERLDEVKNFITS